MGPQGKKKFANQRKRRGSSRNKKGAAKITARRLDTVRKKELYEPPIFPEENWPTDQRFLLP